MHSEANSPENKELDLPKQSETTKKKVYVAKLYYNGFYRFIFSETLSKRTEIMLQFIKI